MIKKKIVLLCSDILAIVMALLISIFIRKSDMLSTAFGHINFETLDYVIFFIFAIIVLMFTFGANRLYDVRQINISARIFAVLRSLFIWSLIIIAGVFSIKFDFSRVILFLTIIFSAIFICLIRYIYFKHNNNSNISGTSVHIIGKGERSETIGKEIAKRFPNISIIHLDFTNINDRRKIASLPNQEIFIADEKMTRSEVMNILSDDLFIQHGFRVISDTFQLTTGKVQSNGLDDFPVISASHKPNLLYFIIKRLTDIIISSISLCVILPIWLLIMFLIKFDSKGPAIIKQRRIGFNSNPFILYKFRTMRSDNVLYEAAPKNENDPRITSVGRYLRRYSLDELPQLWNILKGDMSLVGPRPEMEFIVRQYKPWQQIRLNVKPGLTGLWQIVGRKDIPLHENLEYDFYYVANQCLSLDLSIIIKTIPAVLFGRGAY